MLISATVDKAFQRHQVKLTTGGKSHALDASANGGELLCLAMATCYCNDLYREAVKRGIEVAGVEVQANAEFEAEGAPAGRLSYRVVVRANAAEADIRELILHTDRVAEVQSTLRLGLPVTLESFSAVRQSA